MPLIPTLHPVTAQVTEDWPVESIYTMDIGKWQNSGFFFFFLRVSGWPAVFFSCIWLMGGTQGILEGSEFFTSPSVAPLSCTSLEGWWQLLTGANLQVASLSAICCWVSQLFYPYCNQFPGLNSFCLKYLNGFLFPDHILSDTHSKFI